MLMALQAAIWAGPAQTREIARAARAFPAVPGASASVADLLLEGYSARFTLGYQASVQPFRAAVAALLADDLDPAVGLRWFALGTAAAGSLWDDQATFELSGRWVKWRVPRARSRPCRSRWSSTRSRNPWPATSARPTRGGP